MIYSIIDIGSNTVKMNIFTHTDSGISQTDSQSTKCSLGLCRENGRLNDEGIKRLKNVLLRYTADSARVGADGIFAFATASLRGLENTDGIINEIKNTVGIDIDVIDGEKEAECSYLGLRFAFPDIPHGIMTDMGGGSCEAVLFDKNGILTCDSLPFGALKLKSVLNTSDIPTPDDEKNIGKYLLPITPSHTCDDLFAVGGTARGIFKLFGLCSDVTDSFTLEQGEAFYRKLGTSADTVRLLEKYLPDRADSFMTGFYAHLLLARTWNIKKIHLCKAGAREGYLIKKLGL